VKALGKITEFERELSKVSGAMNTIGGSILIIEGYLPKIDRIGENVSSLSYASRSLDKTHDFLLKYNDFFETVDKKFGTNIAKINESSKRTIGYMKKEIGQIIASLSQKKFKAAEEAFESFKSNFRSLTNNLNVIIILPHNIDYSKLSNRDWRMIGIAGIHYRSKVFLSYYFRDIDPKKDENQQMIDYYVKPTLELLNIEAVTARSHLKPQELVDDKIIELIEDCDGIIGFYTEDNSVENIEHELSKNPNIAAICREEGAKAPSMRLSRLLINFEREQMGDFLMQLIRALKDRSLFRLMI